MPTALLFFTSVLLSAPAQLPGTFFHAERFAANAKVVDDPTALGGKAVRGTRWYYFCRQVPFPQGDGDYRVWLRVKTEGPDNPIQLGRLQDKNLTILAAAVGHGSVWGRSGRTRLAPGWPSTEAARTRDSGPCSTRS